MSTEEMHTLLFDRQDIWKLQMSDTYKLLLQHAIAFALMAHNEAFEHGDSPTLRAVRTYLCQATPYAYEEVRR